MNFIVSQYLKNIKKLCVLLGLIVLAGCGSNSASQYPSFTTSKADISEARRNFRKSDNNFLSLLLVDRDGKVVKVRKLASKLDDNRQDLKVTRAMYDVVLNKAAPSEPAYREFILPYTVGVNASRDPTETTREAYQPREYIPPHEF